MDAPGPPHAAPGFTTYRAGRTRPGSHAAFTLIEVLLVLAIIGVLAAITIPTFVRSMRGNRLRAAARTVAMAGRYARSMAVLNQNAMAVRFDLDAGQISIGPLAQQRPPPGPEAGEEAAWGGFSAYEPSGVQTNVDAGTNGVSALGSTHIERRLDRVVIESVEIEDSGDRFTEGRCTVRYFTNGRCQPYTVTVTDEQGDSTIINVDALSSVSAEEG